MTSKIAIVTIANPKVGFGHLNRCLVLADAFNILGVSTEVYLLPTYEGVDKFLESRDRCSSIRRADHLPNPLMADTCIIDLYCIEQDIIRAAREQCSTVIVFDDSKGNEIPDGVDAVINTNEIRSGEYKDVYKVFGGAKYCLLRPEFSRTKWKNSGNRVIICMGGSDPEGQTYRLVRISQRWLAHRDVVVIQGPGFEADHGEVQQVFENITVMQQPKELASVMASAKLAVSASGTMLYEFIALGVPVACLSLDDSQRKIALSCAKINGVQILGEFDIVKDEEIGRSLREFDKTVSEQKIKIGSKARFVDGQGDRRLARDLITWLDSRQ